MPYTTLFRVAFVVVTVNPVGGGARNALRHSAIDAEQHHQLGELADRAGPLAEPAGHGFGGEAVEVEAIVGVGQPCRSLPAGHRQHEIATEPSRKSTRLNSSH